VDALGFFAAPVMLLASVASVFIRWRRAGDIEREQLKWLVYVAIIIAASLVGDLASASYFGEGSYVDFLALSSGIVGLTVGVPVALGVAVLRHRLYDIDLLINRTLVYATLTATLIVVYFGGIAVLQRLFVVLTGEKSTLAVVASTLVIAALFNPLRRRLQALVDRRFYRRKYLGNLQRPAARADGSGGTEWRVGRGGKGDYATGARLCVAAVPHRSEGEWEAIRMSPRAASWLAWSICAVSLLLMAFSLMLIILGWSTPLPRGWISWQEQTLSLVGFIGAPVLGGLIASRRPDNPYGWLWLALGMSIALMQFGQAYATYAVVVEPGSLIAPRTVVTVLGQGFLAAIIISPFVLLLFPDGHLPSPRWRLVAWVVVLVGVPLLVFPPFVSSEGGIVPVENPIGIGGTAAEVISTLIDPGILIILAAILLSVPSLVFRYRHATGIQRQQIKWFAYAAALNGFLVAIDTLGFSGLLFSYSFGYELWTLLGTMAFATLYVAVGVAILRYRLYDIDRIINRTLVYGSLTATLAVLYFGSVVSLQAALRALAGQESTLAIVASTLGIAALFNPLRRRVQGFVDRRFYRRKYDAARTLEAFNARLRDETDLNALSNGLVGAARDTMQPAHVSLWLCPDTASKGKPTD
jgi:hypothetical protein